MQALRHCCLCPTGGPLHSRTDFLLIRTNMAAFRRGASCVTFIRNRTSAFSSRKSTRQPLLCLPDATRTSLVSISASSALSAVPFTQQVENLSHESLIRRASSLVLDSSNTYLSQTTLALVDSLTQYVKALHTLIALQKQYLASLGKLSPAEEDNIWQVIIGQRVEVDDRLNECNRFETNWVNAINLCEMAIEVAYKAGAEHASFAAKTNVQVAQSQVDELRQLSKDAEKKLAETRAEEIQRMAEYSSLMERNGDDFPEAYLRED